jgi:ParB family chromosome partitioning protein
VSEVQEALINSEAYTEGVLYRVRIDQLEPNPNSPRRDFDEEPLRELADSIREVGVLQSLVVTAGDGPAWRNGKLRTASGERRWRAAQMAGLKSVPVIIRRLTSDQEMQMLLVENLQREDLTPLEEARALDALLKQYGWTQRALGEKLGKSQAWIANRVRLLRLPEKVLQALPAPPDRRTLLYLVVQAARYPVCTGGRRSGIPGGVR